MLKLQQIVKDYQAGDTTVHALRGVSSTSVRASLSPSSAIQAAARRRF